MLKFGQMSFRKLSTKADYLQLNICNMTVCEALEKYKQYQSDIPVILHGDWKNGKGGNENNLRDRVDDYIEIINTLKGYTKVLGITIHPPSKKKFKFNEIIDLLNYIETKTDVEVFLENRSDKSLNCSDPKDVIKVSFSTLMTIDIPQLFIACNYEEDLFYEILNKINWENVRELHISNIKDKRVAARLKNGILDYSKIMEIIFKYNKSFYITFEILGSHNTFTEEVSVLDEIISIKTLNVNRDNLIKVI